MSFAEFLEKCFSSLPTLLEIFTFFLNKIINNNFFKLTIYVIIFSFIIYVILKIIDFIKNIFKLNGKSDIE